MAASDEYKRAVWHFIEEIKPSNRYTIEKVHSSFKPENKQHFIDALKEYMLGFPYDGGISFNADFSKFYKSSALPAEAYK